MALDALPMCGNLPDVSSAPAALGSLYVTESLTLEEETICRRLSSAGWGLSPSNGMRFFHGYGPEAITVWEELCELVAEGRFGAVATLHD